MHYPYPLQVLTDEPQPIQHVEHHQVDRTDQPVCLNDQSVSNEDRKREDESEKTNKISIKYPKVERSPLMSNFHQADIAMKKENDLRSRNLESPNEKQYENLVYGERSKYEYNDFRGDNIQKIPLSKTKPKDESGVLSLNDEDGKTTFYHYK